MRLPHLSAPVKRPELVQPHTTVDVIHGEEEDRLEVLVWLVHGANHNDPPAFQLRSYEQNLNT